MDRPEIADKLLTLISTSLESPRDQITEDSRFVDDLDADSLDMLELVVQLKEHFAVTVSDGEVKALLVELARFLPDASLTSDDSDAEFAEITRRLTIANVVDFIVERTSVGPTS